MTAREVLAGIKGRLTKATPGPWEVTSVVELDTDGTYKLAHVTAPDTDDEDAALGIALGILRPDAVFIAAAPVDVARLTRAVENVLEQHFMEYIEEGDDSRNRCMECLYEQEADEPCPTVAAIEDALNPKEGQ